jgi:hypothetical protein
LRAGPGRPSFTYDGKPFGQWVAQLRRDLSPERRTEAIKALTAFGSHGYGKEAAEAIVAAMRDYHFDVATVSIMDVNSATSTDPIRIMKRAAMEAVTTRPGRSDDRPAIAPEDAVPVLIDELKQGPPNGRLFAAAACYKIGEAAKSAIPALVELVKTGKDSEVRIGALRAVARVENAGDTTVSLVVEIAKGNDRRLAGYAFGNVVYDILRKHHIGEQSYGPYGPGGRGSFGKVGRSGRGPAETPPIPEELNSLVKAVIEAVADEDRNISDAALSVLRNLGRGPKKEAIPNLIQAIEKHPFSAISGAWTILADLGPEANAALPALEKLRNTLKAEAEQRGVPFGPNLIDDVISRVKGEPSPGAGPSPADPRRGRGGPPTRGGAPSGATEGGKPTALSGKSESGEKTAEPPR